MRNYLEISIDELCHYIRKSGIQGRAFEKNNSRKIYDYEILYCAEGNAWIMINEERYELSKGVLITIPPDIPHRFWVETADIPLIYWVHFDFLYRRDVYSLEKLVTEHNKVL